MDAGLPLLLAFSDVEDGFGLECLCVVDEEAVFVSLGLLVVINCQQVALQLLRLCGLFDRLKRLGPLHVSLHYISLLRCHIQLLLSDFLMKLR